MKSIFWINRQNKEENQLKGDEGMKKSFVVLMISFLITCLGIQSTYAETTQQPQQMKQKVELTEQQKEELTKLYEELFEKRKEIIAKKVEFGMISKEKADKINAKMDEHLEMLKQNNFMFHWDKIKKNPHQHH